MTGPRRSPRTTPVKAAKAAKAKPAPEPEFDVSLDLDALQREDTGQTPFVFKHCGETFEMRPRDEVDWRDLMLAARNPIGLVQLVMSKDAFNAFSKHPCPAWKMEAIMDAYSAHYGLPSAGEAQGLLA